MGRVRLIWRYLCKGHRVSKQGFGHLRPRCSIRRHPLHCVHGLKCDCMLINAETPIVSRRYSDVGYSGCRRGWYGPRKMENLEAIEDSATTVQYFLQSGQTNVRKMAKECGTAVDVSEDYGWRYNESWSIT